MAQAKILTRLVSQLRDKGHSQQDAYRIAVSALQKSGNLKPNSMEPTAKGIHRGEMGAAGRAIDRASKASGHSPLRYVYAKSTNRATLRRVQ